MRGRCFQNSAVYGVGWLMIHLIEGDRTITGAARRMEITQQAGSKIVAELTRWGIFETASAGDERNKRIRLSELGWQGVELRRRARARIEVEDSFGGEARL